MIKTIYICDKCGTKSDDVMTVYSNNCFLDPKKRTHFILCDDCVKLLNKFLKGS